jgi:sec-independent protein translocase protein TatC
MSRTFRPIGHDERLSIVDHLDELRTRLIICAVTLLVGFGVCFWQNQHLLHFLNRQLPNATNTSPNHLNGVTGDQVSERKGWQKVAAGATALTKSKTLSTADKAAASQIAHGANEAVASLPKTAPKKLPVTLSPGEPFTTTLTVSFWAGLILSLPVLLYQLYAFVLPALNRRERQVAMPLMAMAPALFVTGVAFAYFIVLGPAIHFLQNYNSKSFDILVGARPLYNFEILSMLGVGLAFQLPLVLIGLDWIGVINANTLIKHWRYALVIIAVLAAALPGPDMVTTGLEMLPLVVLYLFSIVMLKFVDRHLAAREAAELTPIDSLDPTG